MRTAVLETKFLALLVVLALPVADRLTVANVMEIDYP
jgi:hypothetical protein